MIKPTARCPFCNEAKSHFTDLDICCICDDCVLAGKAKFLGITKPDSPGVTPVGGEIARLARLAPGPNFA
jgi:hypothetical protein